jgi:hypothetical protein
MLARMREQLLRCGDLPEAGVEWSLDSELIDLGTLAKDQSSQKSVETVARHVKRRLKIIIRKGEKPDELQENTFGRR